LLVDDSEDDNFFHERAIVRSGLPSRTTVCRDGIEAMRFLQNCAETQGRADLPSVIFLDINMPRMTGWEFLMEYENLPVEMQEKTIVVMLSASMDPLDRARALDSPLVAEFLSKPLTADKMRDIAVNYLGANIAQ
jgi:CheY-like chemotaxis protein